MKLTKRELKVLNEMIPVVQELIRKGKVFQKQASYYLLMSGFIKDSVIKELNRNKQHKQYHAVFAVDCDDSIYDAFLDQMIDFCNENDLLIGGCSIYRKNGSIGKKTLKRIENKIKSIDCITLIYIKLEDINEV